MLADFRGVLREQENTEVPDFALLFSAVFFSLYFLKRTAPCTFLSNMTQTVLISFNVNSDKGN